MPADTSAFVIPVRLKLRPRFCKLRLLRLWVLALWISRSSSLPANVDSEEWRVLVSASRSSSESNQFLTARPRGFLKLLAMKHHRWYPSIMEILFRGSRDVDIDPALRSLHRSEVFFQPPSLPCNF